ncbi:DNA polymerase domain-containing protein [Halovenus sp. HT40]|uniref:DNA polymerase domain-containing protein n=1 Tax=Halovenus sp. HT40 TaxID=3126691 RepID=UPI00300EC36E
MSQTDLGAFEDGTDEGADDGGNRPAAEARAVAGSSGATNAAEVDTSEQLFPAVEETVEMAVMQVDYTIEGRGDDEYPIIHVFGRTAEEELVHAKVFEFKPYFYAPTDNLTEDRLQGYERITDWEETNDEGEPYESIRGEQLTKIFGQTPRDVGQMRDDFDHYEADILFPNRFLIDKDITSGIHIPARDVESEESANGARTVRVHHDEVKPVEVDARPRVNTFDIEVDDRSGFPEDGEEPIICIASHDSYDDEYILWLFDPPAGEQPPEEIPDYEPIDVADGATRHLDHDIRVFDTEEAMLEAFLDYFERTEPDLATGWNFTDFDAPYLLDRLEVLEDGTDHDLDYNRLSRVNEVWRSDWQGPDVKGRVMFDLLYAYQRTKFTELDSYRLEDVGQRELGIGKERYPGDIGDLWENDPERLLEYNLRDVELCVELDRDQDIIAFWNEVRQFVGCKIEDATTPGDAVDMYVLHKLHNQFALPSKGQQESEDYEGGAVFDPISGVRENVSVLDLKSLYPMCMVTINASPETKVDPEEYDGETFRAPNGTRFRKEPDGAIREMVDELLEEREQKKALRNDHDPEEPEYDQYDRQQAAVKVIMNCFTPDTEVLTPDGVRGIRDLEVGDEVYSLDPETMQMEVKPVTETHEYPEYRRELVDIQTSKIDFSVTPNHRMLVRKNETNGITEDEYQFVEAGELDRATNYELPHDWDGPGGEEIEQVDLTELLDSEYEVWANNDVHGHTLAAELGWYPDKILRQEVDDTGYVFSAEEFDQHRDYLDDACSEFYLHSERGRKWIPRFYDGDDFLDLLAWYITEGNVYTSGDKQFGENFRGSATTVKIAQEAMTDGGTTDNHARIGELLDRMGFDSYVDERAYQFTSRLLGKWLETACGGDSFEKRIPEFVFETTERQKRRFLETLIAGDGDRQPNSWRYSTASEQLRDDVLRLCTHLGLTASYNEDSGTYRIYVTEDAKNTLRMHRSGGRSTADDGVYCVTVEDNHTLLAGRNGKFQFVGQSLYGVLGWDRFRLYDREMGAAVTATGREVIDFTEEITDKLDKELVYGDTDSVMIELGADISKEEAIEQSFELEEEINASYDEFASEKLNAVEHRFEIEFEKLYRRFFQAGKKKRYAGHIVWKEGKDVDDIDITGFEHQRSDIAPITKEVQKEVIDRIVTGEDIESIKTYVTEVIDDFQNGEVSPEEIGIPGGIGKRLDNYDTDTAQVRGAKYANLLLGTNFDRGSKPKRVYLDRVHADFFERIEEQEGINVNDDPLYGEFKRDPDVICFEYADQLPEEFEIDWEKMLDKTLKGPIERILEALGVSWEEVKSGQEQKGLGEYM